MTGSEIGTRRGSAAAVGASGKTTQTLNTFAYITDNFARNFAHEYSKYAEKRVASCYTYRC